MDIAKLKKQGICILIVVTFPSTAMAAVKNQQPSRAKKLTKSATMRSVLKDIQDTKKWDVTLGAGIMVGPKYEGSDETEVGVLPMFEIVWNDLVYLNLAEGLGAYFYEDHGFVLSSSIGYSGGRDDGDSKYFKGLGDIDSSVIWTANLEYELGPISPYISMTKHFGGTDGLQGEIGVSSMISLGVLTGDFSMADMDNLQKGDGDKLKAAILFGVSADWANGKYTDGYWSITQQQSVASGYEEYSAEAGFHSVNVDLGLMYPISETWTANIMVGYSHFVGDVADSPLIRDKDQFSSGMILSYTF